MWFISDCSGICCGGSVQAIFIFVNYSLFSIIFIPYWTNWYIIHAIIFISLCIISMYLHLLSMCSNPGAIPVEFKVEPSIILGNNPIINTTTDKNGNAIQKPISEIETAARKQRRKQDIKVCKRCSRIRPRSTHHCSTCGHCIYKMDHHCPWINNCVGQCNQKFFILFCFYTSIASLYSLSFWIYGFVSLNIFMSHSLNTLVFSVSSAMLSVLFFMFTIIMAGEQFDRVSKSYSAIDEMKGATPIERPKMDSFLEIFGEPFSLSWFYPSIPPFVHQHLIETCHNRWDEVVGGKKSNNDKNTVININEKNDRNSTDSQTGDTKPLIARECNVAESDSDDDENCYIDDNGVTYI